MALLNSDTKLYKITNLNEKHHWFQYYDGLNVDRYEFEYSKSCAQYGLYFTTVEHICDFFEYGCWLREVKLPFDNPKLKYVQDPDSKGWRANMIILETKYPLLTVSTLKMLHRGNAQFDKLWLEYFRRTNFSLSYLQKVWKRPYQIKDNGEIYLLALFLVVKIVATCMCPYVDNSAINDYYQCLNDVYRGKYSDIISSSELLTIINNISAGGTMTIINEIIDKIFYSKDKIMSITCLNIGSESFVPIQTAINKEFIYWCFQKYSTSEIIPLSIKYIINPKLYTNILPNQITVDSKTLKQIILRIKNNDCDIDKNKFYNCAVIYGCFINNIELVKFVCNTCNDLVITDTTLHTSLRLLGSFDDTSLLNWWLDKFNDKIINIDGENLGTILIRVVHCSVLNWWLNICQKNILGIKFSNLKLNKIFNNTSCQVLDFWYSKQQEGIVPVLFSSQTLNSIFPTAVEIIDIDKMNWCLSKHNKNGHVIDLSNSILNSILARCKKFDDILILEWLFDQHSKGIINLTIWPETLNKIIIKSVIHNDVKLLNWILDIHRKGTINFKFHDDKINNEIFYTASGCLKWLIKNHPSSTIGYKICDDIRTSIEAYLEEFQNW